PPFGVLVTKPPARSPDQPAYHRDIAWLACEHTLAVLPAVGSLGALRQFAGGGHAPAALVGIGDPTLEAKPGAARGGRLARLFCGAMAHVEAVRQLLPLPEAAEELHAVALALGAGEDDLDLARAPRSRCYAGPDSTFIGSSGSRRTG